MTKIDTIIFDLGGVLIDWNPEYVFLNAFNGNGEKMQWFFDNVCTMAWNENQDAGYPIAQATEDLVKAFPDYEKYIRMYYGDWENMIGGAIQGTVAILKALLELKTYKIVALTNWSAETFPIAQKRFDFLNWFEGIVVSGEEKTRKPHKAIFEILFNRYDITPESSIFIDDSFRNINAANNLGINGVLFVSPEKLQSDLKTFNIKIP